MKLKCSKSFIVTVVALLIVGTLLWRHWDKIADTHQMVIPDTQGGEAAARDEIVRYRRSVTPGVTTNNPVPPQSSNQTPQNLGSN